MMSKSKVPQIRFKGFDGEWEEKELNEILEVLDGDRGHNYPKENDLQKEGHTLFLSASNVTLNGFKFIDSKYITKTKSDIMGNGKLELDDIVLTSRGSLGHIAWYSRDICQKLPFARINSGMLILRPKNNTKPSFVSQFLKSPLGKKKIDLISFGSAQPQLTKKDVSKYTLIKPINITEQTKIGDYFQQLDKLIEQKEKKYQKLKQFKKAMLDKMFPKNGADTPEIRFKGFSGKWEEKKLGDIFNYERPDNYIVKSTEYSNDNKTPVLTANKAFILGYTNELNTFNKPSIIFDDFTLDFKFVDFPYMVKSSALKILTINDEKKDSLIFIYNLLHTIKIEIMGHARHYIGVVQPTNVFVPKIKEQIKIGNYFQKLDKQIDLQQKELEKLKNIKKASLAKMFV